MTGKIFEVKHFAVHDGPGIRTTLFMKGCPLSCVWCHNPESKSVKTELAFYENKCTECRYCASKCVNGAHIFGEKHTIDRAKCVACGACTDMCFNSALQIYGREVTVDEILPELLEDRDFYANGGGVTVSGGECLMQGEFTAELLAKLKKENIHTAVDTCGFAPKNILDKVMPFTDLFLYDIKAYSEEVHIKCTGQSNKIIWDNLKYITECEKKVTVRIPYIPGYNSGEIEQIGNALSRLSNIVSVDVLPYHNFSGSKYEALGKNNTMPQVQMPDKETVESAKNILRKAGLTVND